MRCIYFCLILPFYICIKYKFKRNIIVYWYSLHVAFPWFDLKKINGPFDVASSCAHIPGRGFCFGRDPCVFEVFSAFYSKSLQWSDQIPSSNRGQTITGETLGSDHRCRYQDRNIRVLHGFINNTYRISRVLVGLLRRFRVLVEEGVGLRQGRRGETLSGSFQSSLSSSCQYYSTVSG